MLCFRLGPVRGYTLEAAARTYLGAPFHHAGRSREGGIDCAGLLACCLRDLGIPFDDFQAYRYGADMFEEFARRLEGPFVACEIEEAEVALFRTRRLPCHAAVLTSAGTMIHVMAGGKCVEEAVRLNGHDEACPSFRLAPTPTAPASGSPGSSRSHWRGPSPPGRSTGP